MQEPVLVIKLGSAVITAQGGVINKSVIRKVAAEIASLSKDYRVVLVSSGAVASGKSFIHEYKGSLIEKKAAAAIGNPMLIQLYHAAFSRHGLTVAQALCERHHFSNRLQFLQLKDTFNAFWLNKVIPVVNENDLVSNVELKFSDNDELATLLAIGFDAEALLICTSVGGFLDNRKQVIQSVADIDERIMGLVSNEKSGAGLGGMLSKLTFTSLATSLGIKVMIAGLAGATPFRDALQGKQGTTFLAKRSNLKARQKWLASGSITIGNIEVDAGAEKALRSRKSLLTVGIKQLSGSFNAGEVVQLTNTAKEIIGVAKVRFAANDLRTLQQAKNNVAAHADDIVIF